MDNNRKKEVNKLNNAGKTVFYTFLFLVITGLINDGNPETLSMVAAVLIVVGVALLAFFFGKRLIKNLQPGEKGEESRSYTTHDNHQPRKYDPQMVRNRDAIRRQEQLDSFLQNGLIDKKEYAVLRAHYDKYVEGL